MYSGGAVRPGSDIAFIMPRACWRIRSSVVSSDSEMITARFSGSGAAKLLTLTMPAMLSREIPTTGIKRCSFGFFLFLYLFFRVYSDIVWKSCGSPVHRAIEINYLARYIPVIHFLIFEKCSAYGIDF